MWPPWGAARAGKAYCKSGFGLAFWRRFILYLLLSTSALFTTYGLIEYQRFQGKMERREGEEALRIALVAQALTGSLQESVGALRTISRLQHVTEFADETPGAKERLEREFAAFAENTGVYDQVRYIGIDGVERVRVSFNNGVAVVVPPSKLQNKSQRYYFDHLRHLRPGEVYISPMDLNIEYGRIEQPLKPVIRLGIAVRDSRGRPAGYLILSYLAVNAFAEVQAMMQGAWGTPMMVNREGYGLLCPDSDAAWGFQLPHGRSFAAEAPAAWARIKEGVEGRVRTDQGLYVYTTLEPYRIGRSSAVNESPPVWKLISRVPAGELAFSPVKSLQTRPGALMALLLLMAGLNLPMAWYRTSSLRDAEALAESEERLAEAQRLAHLGSWYADVGTGEMGWSDETYRIFGLVPGAGAAGYQRFLALVHPDDRRRVEKAVDEAVNNGAPYDLEHRIIRPDGSVRTVQEHAVVDHPRNDRPPRLLGTVQDITTIKQSQEELRASEERFRLLAETVEDVFWLTSPDYQKTIYVSSAFERIWGHPMGPLYEDPLGFIDTVHPAERAEVEARLRDPDPGCWDNEYRIATGEGTERWIHDRRFPILDTAGETVMIAGIATDVTEKKLASETLEREAAVFDSTGEALAVTDAEDRILSVNRAFTRITGYSEVEALRRTMRSLAADEHSGAFFDAVDEALRANGVWRGEVLRRRKSGERFPALESISVVRDEVGNIVERIHAVSDISAIKEAEEKLSHLAHHDALTGLPNRLLFNAALEGAVERAKRRQDKVALLFLDLDRFKRINDTLGHQAGDRLLQAIAERLRHNVRAEDTVARLGGDEFTIIMEDVHRSEDALSLAEKLLAVVAEPVAVDGHEVVPSASIGIGLFPDDAQTGADFTRVADIAMYRAKESGRNRCEFYTPELTAAAFHHLNLEHGLRRALAREQFELYYQPQVSSIDGSLVGVEALLRWHHPELGTLSPDAFIGVAEDTELIRPIGLWVLKAAVKQSLAWRREGLQQVRISVNVSGHQFMRNDFPEEVRSALADLTAQPAKPQLELEITESVLQTGADSIAALQELRGLGLSIAIDDFGTGFSSLSQLKHLPVDTLKIAAEFVRNIPAMRDDNAITATIVAMGHTLGLDVVAEGVETEDQLRFLQRQRCDVIQGFLFSEAVPAGELTEILRRSGPLPLRRGREN